MELNPADKVFLKAHGRSYLIQLWAEREAEMVGLQDAVDRVGQFVDLEIAKIPTVLKGENEALIYDHIKTLLEKEEPCQDQ